ncbi:hypothetical protein [Nonomuraea sp. NPDC005501]|uniref:hypothetical protein n=1 Tax=Nonomuraea sp. NPDC005501 TaxID=3156884 RepID=UPI0033AFB2D6
MGLDRSSSAHHLLDHTGTAVDTQELTRVGFGGSTVINRKDFGITYDAVLETDRGDDLRGAHARVRPVCRQDR